MLRCIPGGANLTSCLRKCFCDENDLAKGGATLEPLGTHRNQKEGHSICYGVIKCITQSGNLANLNQSKNPFGNGICVNGILDTSQHPPNQGGIKNGTRPCI